jgi:CheY-like chemotaxis protein
MSFCPGSHAAASYRLVPIREPEQPDSSPEDARGIDQGLRARTSLGGSLRLPGLRNSRREVSQSLQCDGIALGAFSAQISWSHAGRHCGEPPARTARGGMTNKQLVAIVEDDRFFRASMRRLMRSLGYIVEAFPSAADFLASPRLAETACLVADVQMPAMTGIELYRHLTDAGRAIPTILVTGYPNDVDRVRALYDGVVCYLRKPVDEEALKRCLRAALASGASPAENA